MSWSPPSFPLSEDASVRYDPRTGLFSVPPAEMNPAPNSPREFTRLWDVDGECGPIGLGIKGRPINQWSAGNIIRSGQPIFVLTTLGPMYDPSAPETWRPGL